MNAVDAQQLARALMTLSLLGQGSSDEDAADLVTRRFSPSTRGDARRRANAGRTALMALGVIGVGHARRRPWREKPEIVVWLDRLVRAEDTAQLSQVLGRVTGTVPEWRGIIEPDDDVAWWFPVTGSAAMAILKRLGAGEALPVDALATAEGAEVPALRRALDGLVASQQVVAYDGFFWWHRYAASLARERRSARAFLRPTVAQDQAAG